MSIKVIETWKKQVDPAVKCWEDIPVGTCFTYNLQDCAWLKIHHDTFVSIPELIKQHGFPPKINNYRELPCTITIGEVE